MNDRDRKILSFIGAFSLILSTAMLGFSVNEYYATQGYIETKGIVIDYLQTTSTSKGKTTTSYSPVIRFVDPRTGIQYTSSSRLYSSPPEFAIGEQAPILFNPDDPGDYIITNTFKGRYLFMVVPIPFVAIGVIMIAYVIKSRARDSKLKRYPF